MPKKTRTSKRTNNPNITTQLINILENLTDEELELLHQRMINERVKRIIIETEGETK